MAKCIRCKGTGEEPRQTALALPGDQVAAVQAHTSKRQLTEAANHHAAIIVFTYWRERIAPKAGAILDPKRERILVARLRENEGNITELLYAIDGAMKDPHIMGQRMDSERAYNRIPTIFRDRDQVERFLELVPNRHEQHPFLGP